MLFFSLLLWPVCNAAFWYCVRIFLRPPAISRVRVVMHFNSEIVLLRPLSPRWRCLRACECACTSSCVSSLLSRLLSRLLPLACSLACSLLPLRNPNGSCANAVRFCCAVVSAHNAKVAEPSAPLSLCPSISPSLTLPITTAAAGPPSRSSPCTQTRPRPRTARSSLSTACWDSAGSRSPWESTSTRQCRGRSPP